MKGASNQEHHIHYWVLAACLFLSWFFLHVHFEHKYIFFYIPKHSNAVSVGRDWLLKLHPATPFLLSQAGTASKTFLLFVRKFVKWNPPDLHISLTSFTNYTASSSNFNVLACHQHRTFDVMYQRLCFHKILYNQVMFSFTGPRWWCCTKNMYIHFTIYDCIFIFPIFPP